MYSSEKRISLWCRVSRILLRHIIFVASCTAMNVAATTLEKVHAGLSLPWSMTFLSDREMLLTERAGTFKVLDVELGQVVQLESDIEVWFEGQGGLLDTGIAKPYQSGDWIYVTYSKPSDGGASTALARFKIEHTQLRAWQDLFVSNAISDGGRHFGSRIAFDGKGYVYLSSGDRGDRELAQQLSSHAGKIIRLKLDGSIPSDNPFVDTPGAQPEIWTYGHRNPQGLFFDNLTGKLWSNEHGPRGGDEINLIEKGKNYGWPVISYGKEYWAPISVGEGTHRQGMEQPEKFYDPSIAPGSLIVFRSPQLPELNNTLLSGALKLRHINKVELLENSRLGTEERLFGDLQERIRDLAKGPRGALFFITDGGTLYRYR